MLVQPQSKNENFLNYLMTKLKQVVQRLQFKEVMFEEGRNRVTLIAGGVAACAGIVLLLRPVMMPNAIADCESLSQAFATNVHEWIYKCGSGVRS